MLIKICFPCLTYPLNKTPEDKEIKIRHCICYMLINMLEVYGFVKQVSSIFSSYLLSEVRSSFFNLCKFLDSIEWIIVSWAVTLSASETPVLRRKHQSFCLHNYTFLSWFSYLSSSLWLEKSYDEPQYNQIGVI